MDSAGSTRPAEVAAIEDLACPVSGQTLVACANGISTPDGARRYPVSNGIPVFLRYGPTDGSDVEAVLTRLVSIASEKGWLAAVTQVYGPESRMYRYVTDPRRACFLDLLSLHGRQTVLEIGSGFGQMSTELARRSRFTHVLEVVPRQARLVAIKCAEQGLNNVAVACGGDDCRLPYRARLFDVVVVNLVFEWCGSRNAEEPAGVSQQRLLSEAPRVLKPGGLLYLSTKNRYALRYLRGGADEHARYMRFGHALPRRLMNAMLKLRRKWPAPGRLVSHGELRSLLEHTGYGEIGSYWAVPEMRFPDRYVSTETHAIKAARREPGFVQGQGPLSKLAMKVVPARLVRYITPGLTFLARRP